MCVPNPQKVSWFIAASFNGNLGAYPDFGETRMPFSTNFQAISGNRLSN